MGRLGASACTIRSQHAQASFGRTCRITLNRAGTYSRISETSSPRSFSLPRSPDKRPASADTSALRAASARAVVDAPVFHSLSHRPRRQRVSVKHWCFPLASPAIRPAATPVARSDDPASPTCARTASVAAWRSAALNVRSPCRAKQVARAARRCGAQPARGGTSGLPAWAQKPEANAAQRGGANAGAARTLGGARGRRAGMAEPVGAAIPAQQPRGGAKRVGGVFVGVEHAADSRGVGAAVERGGAEQERGVAVGAAGGGKFSRLAAARFGGREDCVCVPGCDLCEGAQRRESDIAGGAGGAGGARERRESAAEPDECGSGKRRGLADDAGRSGSAKNGPPASGDQRRQRGIGSGAGAAVARHGASTLHGAQTAQPAGQSPQAHARSGARGLSPHRVRDEFRSSAKSPRNISGKVAEAVSGRGGFAGRGGREPADVLPLSAKPVAVAAHQQRHRANATGVSPESENAGRAAQRRLGAENILRAVGQRTNETAEDHRLPRHRRKRKNGCLKKNFMTSQAKYAIYFSTAFGTLPESFCTATTDTVTPGFSRVRSPGIIVTTGVSGATSITWSPSL